MLFEKNAFGLRPRTSAARRRVREAGHSVASRRPIPVERRMLFEKNAFGLRPRTSAARRRVREAGHSVASRRAISVDREMHFGLWPRSEARRGGLGGAGHSVAGKRAILAERRMLLAFGRERAPRGGVSERRAIQSPVSGRFLLREECFWPSAANERRETACPRGGPFRRQ